MTQGNPANRPAQGPAAKPPAPSTPAAAVPKQATEVEFSKPSPKPAAEGKAATPGTGLDIGTMFVVGAKDIGGTTHFASVRDAFFTLEYNDLLVDMMKSAGVDHIRRGDEIVVVGDNPSSSPTPFAPS